MDDKSRILLDDRSSKSADNGPQAVALIKLD